MRKRFQRKRTMIGDAASQTIEAQSKLTQIQKHMKPIQSLCGVTQADFNLLYVTTIVRLSDYLTEPDKAIDNKAIDAILKPVILALRQRQGYLLPLGADAEIVFREREVWTYAIFSAASLQAIKLSLRFALAKAIIPNEGYAWLHRHSKLFQLWRDYLKGNDTQANEHQEKTNIFVELIDRVITTERKSVETNTNETTATIEKVNTTTIKATSEKTVENKTTTVDLDNIVVEPNEILKKTAKTIAPEQKIATTTKETTASYHQLPEDTVIKEIDISHTSEVSKKEFKTKSLALPQIPAPTTEKPKSTTEKVTSSKTRVPNFNFTVKTFLQWLKVGIEDGIISYNQPDSYLHRVDKGLLICLPKAVEAFLCMKTQEYKNASSNTFSNIIPTQSRIDLTKSIKRHPDLVKNEVKGVIHAYCWGGWEYREILSGVVMKSSRHKVALI